MAKAWSQADHPNRDAPIRFMPVDAADEAAQDIYGRRGYGFGG
jgi:hypothetical protein